jgi:tRNA-(ms[2]io[6]A)-hydroxylase
MAMIDLRHKTPESWKDVLLSDVNAFLCDHAHNERKVSHSALTLAIQNPRRWDLVDAMVNLAQEELKHFAQVLALLKARGGVLIRSGGDAYTATLFAAIKERDVNRYLLNRLVLHGIIEARGYERFVMAADAFEDGELKRFYQTLSKAEERHQMVYLDLARAHFPSTDVDERLDALLDLEAKQIARMPLSPGLH